MTLKRILFLTFFVGLLLAYIQPWEMFSNFDWQIAWRLAKHSFCEITPFENVKLDYLAGEHRTVSGITGLFAGAIAGILSWIGFLILFLFGMIMTEKK